MKAKNYTWAAGALYRMRKDGVLRRCLDETQRIDILREAHEGCAGGHMAGEVTARRVLQAGYWWDTLFKDAQKWAR